VSSIISHKGLAFTKSVAVANSTIEATKEAAAVFMLTPVAASSIATPYVGVLSTESLPVPVSSIDASINEIADTSSVPVALSAISVKNVNAEAVASVPVVDSG